MRSASVSGFGNMQVFWSAGHTNREHGGAHFRRRRENMHAANSHSRFHMRYDISCLVLSPPLLALSLSHTNTSAMTQASRMCFLSAQLSSGSPRHEITWIRDDRLSDQRKTASPHPPTPPPSVRTALNNQKAVLPVIPRIWSAAILHMAFIYFAIYLWLIGALRVVNC